MMNLIFSFDDGRADNVRLFEEILAPEGIAATMNISTAYVDGTISDTDRPCPNAAMTVDDVKRLASSSLIELAGHGDKHLNTPEDLSEGLRKLRSWVLDEATGEDTESASEVSNVDDRESITDRRNADDRELITDPRSADIIGIASPHSELSADEVLSQRSVYEKMGVEYVRIGPGATYSGLNRVAGKLSRMTKSKGAFLKAYSGINEHIGGSFVLLSVPVLHDHSLSQVKALIEKNRDAGTDVILMFHSILKPGEDYYDDPWSWDFYDFKELALWARDAEGIEVVTTRQAFRGQQRV